MTTFDLRASDATLVIDEGRYAGVEVEVLLDAPYRTRRAIAHTYADVLAAEQFSDEEARALDRLYGLMTGPDGIIVGWNLVIDGAPVPVSADGLHRASDAFAGAVIALWFQWSGKVPDQEMVDVSAYMAAAEGYTRRIGRWREIGGTFDDAGRPIDPVDGEPIVAPVMPEALREARLDRAAFDRGIPLVSGGLDDQPADRLLRMFALTGTPGEG